MNRRKFLSYVGCGCCNIILTSCGTVPITERRQLKIIPESRLNAQAALVYEKVKKIIQEKKKTILKNTEREKKEKLKMLKQRKKEVEEEILKEIKKFAPEKLKNLQFPPDHKI